MQPERNTLGGRFRTDDDAMDSTRYAVQAMEEAEKRKRLEALKWEAIGKKIGAIGCALLCVLLSGGLLGFAWVVVHFIRKFW